MLDENRMVQPQFKHKPRNDDIIKTKSMYEEQKAFGCDSNRHLSICSVFENGNAMFVLSFIDLTPAEEKAILYATIFTKQLIHANKNPFSHLCAPLFLVFT